MLREPQNMKGLLEQVREVHTKLCTFLRAHNIQTADSEILTILYALYKDLRSDAINLHPIQSTPVQL